MKLEGKDNATSESKNNHWELRDAEAATSVDCSFLVPHRFKRAKMMGAARSWACLRVIWCRACISPT
jgi:hypothetical protein